MQEIELMIETFKSKWKYHNISILAGTAFLILSLLALLFIVYTAICYNGDSKMLCIGIEFLMALTLKKLNTNITPSYQDHVQYIIERTNIEVAVMTYRRNAVINDLSNMIRDKMSTKQEPK